MFLKDSTVRNVFLFRIEGAHIVICDQQNNLICDDTIIDVDIDFSLVRMLDNKYLIYSVRSGKTKVINLLTAERIETEITPLLDTYYAETLIGYSDSKLDRTETPSTIIAKYGLFTVPSFSNIMNLSTNKLGKFLRFKNESIFYAHSQVVHCMSLESNEVKWKTAFGNVKTILCINDGILWIEGQLTARYSSIKGIDIKTGELLDYFKGLEIPASPVLKLSLDNNCIFISNRDNAYLELDLREKKVKRQGFIEALSIPGYQFSIVDFTVESGDVYFNAKVNGSLGGEAVGVLNYHTLELVWWERISSEEGAFFGAGQSPKVNGDKFYILDSKSILHVYKRVG